MEEMEVKGATVFDSTVLEGEGSHSATLFYMYWQCIYETKREDVHGMRRQGEKRENGNESV